MQKNLDKNKLKELIQKTPTKNLLYLHINPLEQKSLESALKEIHKFVGTGGAALPAVLAAAATLTPVAWNAIDSAIKSRFSGSYFEYILTRSQSRDLFESKDSVFNRERDADEKDWNSLIEEEFSRDFNGTDFVHGYDYEIL